MPSLQEIAGLKGKKLLIEHFNGTILPEQVEVIEREVITEEVEGKQHKCRGILRNVPVHRIGVKNLNGRIYPLNIEQKILKEKSAENTFALADHPDKDSDGSVTRICGIWKNYRLNEDMTMGHADLYLIGDTGDNVIEGLKLGGKYGTSRVGYGNIDESDKTTVCAEDYELVRLGDIVLTPSANVYITTENMEKEEETKPEPSDPRTIIRDEFPKQIIKNSREVEEVKSLKENFTNEMSEKVKREVNSMDNKILEHMTKNQLNEAIRRADKEQDLVEAIRMVKSVEIPADLPQLKERAEMAISKIEEKLEVSQKQSQALVVENTKLIESLKKENGDNKKKIEEMSASLEKASKILERSGLASSEDVVVLKENYKVVKSDLKMLLEDTQKRDEDLKILIEERSYMLNDISCFKEDRKNMLSDLSVLEETNKKMEKDVNKLSNKLFKAETWIKEATDELVKGGYKFEEEVTQDDEDERLANRSKYADEKEFDGRSEKTTTTEISNAFETHGDYEEDEEPMNTKRNDDIEDEDEDYGDEEVEADDDDDYGDEEDEDDDDVNSDDPNRTRKSKADGTDEEDLNEDEVGKAEDGVPAPYPGKATSTKMKAESRYVNPRLKKAKKEIKEEYQFVKRIDEVKASITRVYEQKVKEFPGLQEIKEEVMSCDSPYDASIMINKYISRKDEGMVTARKRDKMVEKYSFKF